VPGALVVIIAGILAAPWLFAHGVALTGPIDLSPALPQFALPEDTRWPAFAGFSLAVMFILYAESYGSIRTYALKHDDPVQPNRDLFALGVANAIAGLLQGTPVGAGYSATSANDAAGAQSRYAGLTAAAAVLLLVALFLRWIERIPEPVLAAIVIHAVSKSLRFGVFANYFRWQRDRQVALAAVLAVLLFGVLNGLLAAIAFSLAWLVKSLASPRISVLGRAGQHDYVDVERFPQAVREPGLLVLRPEEPVFFANAEPLLARARELVRALPGTRQVVVSFEESPDLDSTAIETLGEFCVWLSAHGIELRVARLRHTVRDALLRAQLTQLSAATLDYSSVDDAVRGECVTPAPPQSAAS
jgi:MFS superfamily sulfate permease-like transporter